jgi:hypothetical protein
LSLFALVGESQLVGLVVLGPAVLFAVGAHLAYAGQTFRLEVDPFVPLAFVSFKVDFDLFLLARRLLCNFDDRGTQPLAHLIEHVQSVVKLEVHSAAPLLLHAASGI